MIKVKKLQEWLNKKGFDLEANNLDNLIKSAGIKEELIAQNPEFEADLTMAAQTMKPNYLRWVVQQLSNQEPINEIINMVAEFEKFKPKLEKKDLFQYQSLGELRGAIESSGPSNSQKKKEVKQNIDGNYETLYDDEQFLVVHPHSKEASCYFGRGTKWCVSATISDNYFHQYAADNVYLYFIISRQESQEPDLDKIAYAYVKMTAGQQAEIFNAQDKKIDEGAVKTKLGEKFQAIDSKIKEHLSKQNNTKFSEYIKRMTLEEYNQTMSQISSIEEKTQIHRAIVDNADVNQEVLNQVYNESVQGAKEYKVNSWEWISANEAILKILRHPKTSPDKLRNAIESITPENVEVNKAIIIAAISNVNCPEDLLLKTYFKTNRPHIKALIAAHPNVPERILEDQSDEDLIYNIINKTELGSNLSNVIKPKILKHILEYRKNSQEVMQALAQSRLSTDHELNKAAIKQLLSLNDSFIFNRLVKNKNVLNQYPEMISEALNIALQSNNEKTIFDILYDYGHKINKNTLNQLATNKSTDRKIRDQAQRLLYDLY